MAMKITIALNTSWNLVNFRSGLIRALVERGYEVVAIAPDDEYSPRLKALGCRFVALPMDNKGTNPLRDLLLFVRFYNLFRRERPDVFLAYTPKPNIYGSFAAQLLGIPVVNNIAGLGATFIRKSWLTSLVLLLHKAALANSRHVFFQNQDDMKVFLERDLVDADKVSRLPGSGVDLEVFRSVNKSTEGDFTFLLVARMMWNKGVGEYVEAARIVRARYPRVRFKLLGFLDVKNPTAISRAQMSAWVAEGVVEYLGQTDDVKPYFAACDCAVLPSYREGVPRSLLEAAAMGCPIVASDAPGCKDALDDGISGLLCRVKDSVDLAEKLMQMVAMPQQARKKMGEAGRRKMVREFDENIVIGRYLQVINGY